MPKRSTSCDGRMATYDHLWGEDPGEYRVHCVALVHKLHLLLRHWIDEGPHQLPQPLEQEVCLVQVEFAEPVGVGSRAEQIAVSADSQPHGQAIYKPAAALWR